MVWKKTYGWRHYSNRQEPTNQKRRRKIFSFVVDGKTFTFKPDKDNAMIIQRKANQKQLTRFINECIAFRQSFERNPETILSQLIPEYFRFSKHIVRQVGRAEKRAERLALRE